MNELPFVIKLNNILKNKSYLLYFGLVQLNQSHQEFSFELTYSSGVQTGITQYATIMG